MYSLFPVLIPLLYPFANSEDATFQNEQLNSSVGIRKTSLQSFKNIHCSLGFVPLESISKTHSLSLAKGLKMWKPWIWEEIR